MNIAQYYIFKILALTITRPDFDETYLLARLVKVKREVVLHETLLRDLKVTRH